MEVPAAVVTIVGAGWRAGRRGRKGGGLLPPFSGSRQKEKATKKKKNKSEGDEIEDETGRVFHNGWGQ